MNVRTCPWRMDDGSICSAPSRDSSQRIGLCRLHSSAQYMTQLVAQGDLLIQMGVTNHSPGYAYVAVTSGGNYRIGYAGTYELLLPKLRKSFRDGELARIEYLLDGGKSRFLILSAQLSDYRVDGLISTYLPETELSDLIQSEKFSDLPEFMTGTR